MRKNNPQFKQLVNGFIQSYAVGTSFGSTLLRRWLQKYQMGQQFDLGGRDEKVPG